MRIGFLGVHCGSGNLGVDALAYSAVKLMDTIAPGKGEFYFFSTTTPDELAKMARSLGIDDKACVPVPFSHKSPSSMLRTLRLMRSCDAMIDLTGGDSFSDIYGLRRLLEKLFDKEMVLASGAPLILGPQTYGPFQHRVSLPWVRRVLRRSALVFARDSLSQTCGAEVSGRDPDLSTDVALGLPWNAGHYDLPSSGRVKLGLNVSGLLWHGGYTGGNQFDLRTDYRRFCHTLITRLLEVDEYDIYLLPHVIARDPGAPDDDLAVCRALVEAHPNCILSPIFTSPVDAKSFISQLDVLVGSRMHATIAAFSSGVPPIPVAYSRKFKGLFGSLGYPALVDLSSMDTQESVETALDLVGRVDQLRVDVAAARGLAESRLEVFRSNVGSLLAGRLRSGA